MKLLLAVSLLLFSESLFCEAPVGFIVPDGMVLVPKTVADDVLKALNAMNAQNKELSEENDKLYKALEKEHIRSNCS